MQTLNQSLTLSVKAKVEMLGFRFPTSPLGIVHLKLKMQNFSCKPTLRGRRTLLSLDKGATYE
jgi:hypothetical protein